MPPEYFLDKYPRTKRFLKETGYSLDQALIFTESELKKIEKNWDYIFHTSSI